MHTIYLWRHTDPLTGKRRSTRHRLTEDEARAKLIDPVRIESSAMVIELTPHGVGWCLPSGLVRGTDGAMLPPAISTDPCDQAKPSTPSPP